MPGIGCCRRSGLIDWRHRILGAAATSVTPTAWQEKTLDDALFDALTRRLRSALHRRRFLVHLSATLSALPLALLAPKNSGARKRCRKGKTRCGNRCVRGTCCIGKSCGGNECACHRSIEGKTFCARIEMTLCQAGACGSSAECGAGNRCAVCANGGETACMQKCNEG